LSGSSHKFGPERISPVRKLRRVWTDRSGRNKGGLGGLLTRGLEKAEQPAFVGGLIGAGAGLLLYLTLLIGDLR
jgi:hypothetical protein